MTDNKQHNPCTCGSTDGNHPIYCDVFKPLQRTLPCANCHGKGIYKELYGEFGQHGYDYVVCARCEGTGEVIDPRDRPARKTPERKQRKMWWNR